jgi:hypothetical protein
MKRASHDKMHTHSVRRSTAWRFGLQCDLLREPFPRYGCWTRLPTKMLPSGRTEHATYPASAPRHRTADVAREPFLAGIYSLYRLDLAVSYIPILTMSSIPHLQVELDCQVTVITEASQTVPRRPVDSTFWHVGVIFQPWNSIAGVRRSAKYTTGVNMSACQHVRTCALTTCTQRHRPERQAKILPRLLVTHRDTCVSHVLCSSRSCDYGYIGEPKNRVRQHLKLLPCT